MAACHFVFFYDIIALNQGALLLNLQKGVGK